MPSFPETAAVCGALLVVSVYVVRRLVSRRSSAPLPPGPRGLPFIGNLLDWPTQKRWETFSRWGKLYGDITYLNVAGQPIVFLNSPRLAIDMFERKGAIYSSRPFMYFASKLVGYDTRSPATAPYGDDLRSMRRMMSKVIGNKALVERFAPMQEHEVQRFLRRVLDAPHRLFPHIRKLANSMILNVSHGYQVAEGDDPMVALAERVMADFAIAVTPGSFLVDHLPILDKLPVGFPGTGFRQIAARMNQTADEFFDVPHAWVKQQIANGTARPSFVADQLEGNELSTKEDKLVKAAAGAFFGGGSETTISAIIAFFLAMTLHPEVQIRARAEIDAALGPDRLPTLADRDRLPYVDAVCKEVLRWATPTPLGGIRALEQDDIQDGYFIPKGTYIFGNYWGFLRDPSTYKEPDRFDPARFVPTDGSEPEKDPREYVFGFGRRICPGATLFDVEFFLTCAMTLATLDIGKDVDNHGTVIEPEKKIEQGLFYMFKPFRCSIKPRSAEAELLVREFETYT